MALHDPKIRKKEQQPRLAGTGNKRVPRAYSHEGFPEWPMYIEVSCSPWWSAAKSGTGKLLSSLPFKETPICVTMEEKADLEKLDRKTIPTLREEIEFMLASIADDSIKEAFTEIFHGEVLTKKGAVKADYLAIHIELAEFLENDNDYVSIGEVQDD